MSERSVKTCDVCDRELPLRGVKGQLVRNVRKVRVWWCWWGKPDNQWEPEDVCEDCWGHMVVSARELREALLAAPPQETP